MRKILIISLLLIGVLASGCTQQAPSKIEKHLVVKVFIKRPVSVHDQISPRFYAVLDNEDTVPVGPRTRAGDTITYKYYQHVEK